MPGPDPDTAKALGVPVAPGNPYVGMQAPEAQKAAIAERVAAKDMVKPDLGALNAAQHNIELVNQYLGLAQKMDQRGLLGPDIHAAAKRAAALRLVGSQDATDLLNLDSIGNQLIGTVRAATGISRVTNFDMNIFKEAGLGSEKTLGASKSIANGMLSKFQRDSEAMKFSNDYVDANGSTRGLDMAWDNYQAANPVFAGMDKDGTTPLLNQNRMDRRTYFRDMADIPAPGPRGQEADDPVSGRHYWSDGMVWVPVPKPQGK
jgi:hypothetical protein